MRTPTRIGAGALALALVVAFALPADAAYVDDPDLARGPLDLKRLAANKHDATSPLFVRIDTYGKWRSKLLDEDGGNRLHLLFNTNSDGTAEFVGEIFFRNGRLSMRVTRRNGAFVRRIPVRHPRRASVRMKVPRGLPNPDGQVLLAATMTYRTDTGPCASVCDERIPNSGWLKVTPGL